MDPTVISDTIQEFNGVRYYLCGNYFQRGGRRLHRLVWTTAHGPVPPGFHIHHIDGDRTNNVLSNLTAVDGKVHVGHHARERTPARVAASLRSVPRLAAGNRRITAEQRRAAAQRGWEGVQRAVISCTICGKEVVTPFPSRTKFCGLNCRQSALRARRRADRAVVAGVQPVGGG